MELDTGVDPVGHMMTNPIGNSHNITIMFMHCAPLGAVRHIVQDFINVDLRF